MRLAIGNATKTPGGGICRLVLLILLSTAGCTNNQAITSLDPAAGMGPQSGASALLLLPVDVRLSEVTAAGLLEPRADWTNAARKHMDTALEAFFSARNLSLVRYQSPSGDPQAAHDDDQLLKLHEQVGGSIMRHLYNSDFALPTKQKKLDWSLGPDVVRLGRDRNANYGLFIYVRDSYTTAGRALMIGIAAAFGVGLVGGQQVGFASLVDLKTGDVVWFRRLARGTGDLRTADEAEETISELLADFPA